MINKTILNVPYAEKDHVKMLGAKWDPQQKVWFIPPGKPEKAFKQWLSMDVDNLDLLVSEVGLLRTIIPCWSCKGFCTINAIYAKKIINRSIKQESNEFSGNLEGQQSGFYILTNISKVPDALLDFLLIRCPYFKLGKANNLGQRLYRNHCDHCSIGISDIKLHKKSGGLNPSKLADMKSMQFIDLLFFDDLEIKADYIDYSEHKLYSESITYSDYLTDYI